MSVVFTDSFTVGANTNIDAYPSGDPDYAYNSGSGTNLVVNAANDRVQPAVTGAYYYARIIDATGGITGDQEISATTFENADSYGGVTARTNTSGTADAYFMVPYGGNIDLYREDTGTATLLSSTARTWTSPATSRFKVTGSGATVALEAQIAATAIVTYNDSNANRKTSGAPGVIAYAAAAGGYVDNVSVDDLAVAGTTVKQLAALGVG